MTREDLERFLDKGHELGFVKRTDDPAFPGWILLRKRKANQRLMSLLDPNKEGELLAKERSLEAQPYQVQVIELSRDVFENDRYETEEDYRLNDVYFFATLDEVEGFVGSLGHSLDNIKWRIEINAP